MVDLLQNSGNGFMADGNKTLTWSKIGPLASAHNETNFKEYFI